MWILHTNVNPGESLSSWLVRVSLASGCDPLSLTSCIWPGWRAWTHDIDRSLTAAQVCALASLTGLSHKAIYALTLGELMQVSPHHLTHPINGAARWLIPRGIRNRTCVTGAQFCPVCLAEDLYPYFRLEWRLALATACIKHKCLLSAFCPCCGKPVQYHRLTAQDRSITCCFNCGANLCESESEQVDDTVIRFQDVALRALNHENLCDGFSPLAGDDWLALGRYYIQLVRIASRQRNSAMKDLFRCVGVRIHRKLSPPSALPLEYLSTNERAALYAAVWPLLRDGTAKFVALAQECGLTRTALEAQYPPRFLNEMLRILPENSVPHAHVGSTLIRPPRSQHAVERQWALFLRRTSRG